MQRRTFIAGNWKMNPVPKGALETSSPYRPRSGVDVVIFPASIDLKVCLDAGLECGAQFGHPSDAGAFTGDISMAMIAKIGCRYVLCGHSERREHHKESNEAVAAQVASALAHGLIPVLCVGETADQREMDKAEEVVREQLSAVKLDSKVIIAYEPVWAIGTGKTPTPADAEKMHAFIRGLLPKPEEMRIIYGGSMNAKNAADLLAQPDIDGGLPGGASLKPAEFAAIVNAAEKA